jgi:hypothetical protein
LSTFYDIFNGDADGICALHQLRLEEPRSSVLVTGVKRDIVLLDRVDAAAGDELTVLDISLKSNVIELERLLGQGAHCRYFDHHATGEIPQHANLSTFIDTAPDICTSLIVDRYLSGRQRIWAVVAAFGDNLVKSALRAAELLELGAAETERLRELGECLNYNAYGETVDDLHYPPAELFETLSHYRDPRDFIDGEPVFEVLRNAYRDDLDRVDGVGPEFANDKGAVFILPDAPVEGQLVVTVLFVRAEPGVTAFRPLAAAFEHAVFGRPGTAAADLRPAVDIAAVKQGSRGGASC